MKPLLRLVALVLCFLLPEWSIADENSDKIEASFQATLKAHPDAFQRNAEGKYEFNTSTEIGKVATKLYFERQSLPEARSFNFLEKVVSDASDMVRNKQSEASEPTPATSSTSNILTPGQFVIAISDELNVQSSSNEGWDIETGEVYKFKGLTATSGIAYLELGGHIVKANWKNFMVVPDADIPKAAMKYSDEVKELRRIESRNASRSSDPVPETPSQPQPSQPKQSSEVHIGLDGKTISAPTGIPMRGQWAERSGAWRGPDGGPCGQQTTGSGPYRIHHRAVDPRIETLICKRDTAVFTGQLTETEADAIFAKQLEALQLADQNAASQQSMDAIQAQLNRLNQKVNAPKGVHFFP